MSRRLAVVVGCNDFDDAGAFAALDFAVDDMIAVAQLMKDSNWGAFDEVCQLPNPSSQEVRKNVERIARCAENGDMILVYFSGHGKRDIDGTLKLITSDTEADLLGATSVAMEEIKQWFNISRASSKAIILDCCYAGAASDNKFKDNVESKLAEISRESSGLFLLAASSSSQSAKEISEKQQGALTHCILEGIQSGAVGGGDSEWVTASDVASYVKNEVPRVSTGQSPQSWESGSRVSIRLAKRVLTLNDEIRMNISKLISGLFADDEITQEVKANVEDALQRNKLDQLQIKWLLDLEKQKLKPGPFSSNWVQHSPAADGGAVEIASDGLENNENSAQTDEVSVDQSDIDLEEELDIDSDPSSEIDILDRDRGNFGRYWSKYTHAYYISPLYLFYIYALYSFFSTLTVVEGMVFYGIPVSFLAIIIWTRRRIVTVNEALVCTIAISVSAFLSTGVFVRLEFGDKANLAAIGYGFILFVFVVASAMSNDEDSIHSA